MRKQNYGFEVLVNGRSVKEYDHEGKTFIEGRKGSRFTLRVKNDSWRRIVAVPTVDGLSVMDGKPASVNSTGYVIEPFSSYEVTGWRRDEDTVAEFYFAGAGRSYARRSGKGKQNCGVIGCAIFEERMTFIFSSIPSWRPAEIPSFYHFRIGDNTCDSVTTSVSSSTSGMASSATLTCASGDRSPCFAKQELGTGWGENRKSRVRETSFERQSSPAVKFHIFYDSRKQLKRRGILADAQPIEPCAFPKDRWCKPPR